MASFTQSNRQLDEDVRTFANWIEDLYDQAFPDSTAPVREFQLRHKLMESLPLNMRDILLTAKDCSFTELVQYVYEYDLVHGNDHAQSHQPQMRAPGTKVHRCASEPVQETCYRQKILRLSTLYKRYYRVFH